MRWLISPNQTEPHRRAAVLVLALLSLSYPPLVYFGLAAFPARWLALLLLLLAVLRALTARNALWWLGAALTGALALAAFASDAPLPLKLYPVMVNAALLTLFAGSLRYPPSLVERMARLREPDLPAHAVRYTRTVTKVWCGFFIVNGAMALLTALYADEALWALYNGLISYLFMGLLFAGEWLVRQRVRARHD